MFITRVVCKSSPTTSLSTIVPAVTSSAYDLHRKVWKKISSAEKNAKPLLDKPVKRLPAPADGGVLAIDMTTKPRLSHKQMSWAVSGGPLAQFNPKLPQK